MSVHYPDLTPEEREVLRNWTPPVWLMVPGDYLRGLTYAELVDRLREPVWEGDDE